MEKQKIFNKNTDICTSLTSYVYNQFYTFTTTDCDSQLKSLKHKEPDLCFALSSSSVVLLLMMMKEKRRRNSRKLKKKKKLLTSCSVLSYLCLEISFFFYQQKLSSNSNNNNQANVDQDFNVDRQSRMPWESIRFS